MFGAFERRVAFRYLRARKGERFVSIIAIFSLVGIALGVATLIVVMSVMNGFRQELLSQILGVNGHLAVYGISHPIEDFDAVVDRILKVPGVEEAVPQAQGQVMVSANDHAAGGLVHAIRLADLKQRKRIADHIVAGSLDDMTGDSTVVIGARNEEQLKANLGAVGWSLTQAQMTKLDAASERPKTYPYWHQAQFAERNPFPT